MPASYPREMRDWWQVYRTNDDNKLGHDALLCGAELGLQELADITASICVADFGETPNFGGLLRRHGQRDRGRSSLGFGHQLRLLRECIGKVDGSTGLRDLKLARRDGRTAAPDARASGSAGLQVVLDSIANLHDADSRLQLKDVDRKPADPPTVYEAWDALVTYRNRTLGHPDYRVIGVRGYYKAVTPLVADCVAELLWGEDVRRVMYRYQMATFDRPLPGRRYRVHARVPGGDGLVAPYEVASDRAANMEEADLLVVEFNFGRSPEPGAAPPSCSFRAPFFAPEQRDAPTSPTVAAAAQARQPAAEVAAPAAQSPEAAPAAVLSHGLVHVLTAPPVTGTTAAPAPSVPPHPFALGSLPVTQKLYEVVTGEPWPARFRGDNRPVESISWYECLIFCNMLSRREGLTEVYTLRNPRTLDSADMAADGYRLPTELEWTFACVGAEASLPGEVAELAEVAWYHANADGRTHDVGEKRPNRLGIYDMLGNVSEWCYDRFKAAWTPSASHPEGPQRGMDRVCKGGSWNSAEFHVTPQSRHGTHPETADKYTGLRLARTMASHAPDR